MQPGAIYWANFNENYGKLLTFFTEESSKERVFVLRLSGHSRSILLPPYFWQWALGPCFLCLQLYTEWTTELKKIYYFIILFGIYQCICVIHTHKTCTLISVLRGPARPYSTHGMSQPCHQNHTRSHAKHSCTPQHFYSSNKKHKF